MSTKKKTLPKGIQSGDLKQVSYMVGCGKSTVSMVLNGERSDNKGIVEELERLIDYRESRRRENLMKG